MEDVLIRVWFDADSDGEPWTVEARESIESEWDVSTGKPGDLSSLLSIAHDIVTGG